jgi:hypothetical protein
MSTVYRARENGNVRVAIKQFSASGLAGEEKAESVRWLAREAGLLSSLHNPHLPGLIAAFSDGDDHYVVMPYVAGKTIKELVSRNGPMSEDDVLRASTVLAEVLAYLHEQDPPIIHRDLKPDNILMQSNGHLVLLDLGVARPLVRSILGTAIGTPGYAAPEQYQGLSDERSDLYALGATLHYMLTGYDAEDEAPFRHPPLRLLRPDVSPTVDGMVATLLQIVPENRPPDAKAVAQYAEYYSQDIQDVYECDVASRLAGRAVISSCVVGAIVAGSACVAGVMAQTHWHGATIVDQLEVCQFAYVGALWAVRLVEWCLNIRERSAMQSARDRLKQARKMRTLASRVVSGGMLLCCAALGLCALAYQPLASVFISLMCLTLAAGLVAEAVIARAALIGTATRSCMRFDDRLRSIPGLHA